MKGSTDKMSLRDQFAAAAVPGIIASDYYSRHARSGSGWESIARMSYIVADAMLAERAERAKPAVTPEPESRPSDKFFILSLKHSPCEGLALWWCPNDRGYTTDLSKAGMYPQADVVGASDYYDNRVDTVAVRCSEIFPDTHNIGWLDAKRRWTNIVGPKK